jgi:predicted dehydrogenase
MIGVGIVGYGYWGPNLARCVAETEGCQLAAIADPSPAALAKAGKRHPAAGLTAEWQSVIDNPAVDAVLVATPVKTHFQIALASLRAGKHVFVEKPITQTSCEAAVLIAEAQRQNLVLMVDHTFVYTGAVQKIHQLVADGTLGDIYYYDSTRINLGLFQRDVNVIWDLAVHDLAILDSLMQSPPTAVSANGANHVVQDGPDNMAYMTVYFENGMIAHINVNWLAPVKVRQVLIGGSKRMIVYDDLQPSEKVKVYDRGVTLQTSADENYKGLVSYRLGDMYGPELSHKEALLTEIEHFVDCIEHSKVPRTSGESGLRVVKTLEAASLSLRQQGHPIELLPLSKAS